MRNYTLIIFSLLAINVGSQSIILKTNPFVLMNGCLETKISKVYSVVLSARRYYEVHEGDGFIVDSYFESDIGIRYYMSPTDTLSGFYAMPRLGNSRTSRIIFGLDIGNQWILTNCMTFDIGFGFGYRKDTKTRQRIIKYNIYGSVGYAF